MGAGAGRCGIGTLLIRRLFQAAADLGIERVSLSVARENPAMVSTNATPSVPATPARAGTH
jgi:hypothetical protein